MNIKYRKHNQIYDLFGCLSSDMTLQFTLCGICSNHSKIYNNALAITWYRRLNLSQMWQCLAKIPSLDEYVLTKIISAFEFTYASLVLQPNCVHERENSKPKLEITMHTVTYSTILYRG